MEKLLFASHGNTAHGKMSLVRGQDGKGKAAFPFNGKSAGRYSNPFPHTAHHVITVRVNTCLLYTSARIGIPHCPKCGKEIHKQTIDQMVDQIMSMPERTKIQLLAPVVRGRKGEHVKVLDQARKSGYVRVRICLLYTSRCV